MQMAELKMGRSEIIVELNVHAFYNMKGLLNEIEAVLMCSNGTELKIKFSEVTNTGNP